MDSNIEKLRTWAKQVSAGQSVKDELFSVNSAEFFMLYDKCIEAAKWLSSRGVGGPKMRGEGNVRMNGFSLIASLSSIKIHPPATNAKKGVAETSRGAYAALNSSKQAKEVAAAVIQLQGEGATYVSDNAVSRHMGNIPAARVSARRAEIEEAGGIEINGVFHAIETGQKIKCPITGNTVQGWALRKPGELF